MPENLAIVPPGSMIVQAPCGENCSPASSSSLAVIQPGGNAAQNCANYANPCVRNSFVVPGIGKEGSFYATCASAWAIPGIQLYFGGNNYLEVLGVSGDVIRYRNLSIEPGFEILAGVCFSYGPAGFASASDEESGENEASSELDAIYGEDGNVKKKILPVNGMMLFACGGKWLRRAAGLMFFPVAATDLVSYSGAATPQSFAPNLANKPTKVSCSLGMWAQLSVKISATATVSNQFPTVEMTIGGRPVATVHAHPSYHYQHSEVMVDTNDAATLPINVAIPGGAAGTMTANVKLLGYWH